MSDTYFPKLACFLGVVFSAVCGLNAQNINPRIDGLGIGSEYTAIVKKLGKPHSDKRGGEVPCGDTMRTLYYRGLVLRLEVGGMSPLGLYKVEITSNK